MRVYTIYIATNTINGKKYVGFDSAWPRRMKGHLTAAYSQSSKQYKQRFHAAIRKYGKENFIWEDVYQSLDGEHTLNVMELHFIQEHRTYIGFDDCNGYNLTLGGEGQLGRIMSNETKRKKSEALKGRPSPMSKRVHTPFGIFAGMRMASTELGISVRTIAERIKRSSFPDWYYHDEGNIPSIVATRDGRSKQISTPHGVFPSISRCSTQLNIPKATIQTRVESPLYSDWYHTGVTTKTGIRSVTTPYGVFNSVAEAARTLALSKSTVAAKLRSKKNQEWYYNN